MHRVHGFTVARVIVKSSYFTQFAIKYCFIILRNVYSSKKRVDCEFNSILLKKSIIIMMMDRGIYSENILNTCMISFNLLFSTNIMMEIDRLLLPPACYYTSATPVSLRPTAWLCVKMYTHRTSGRTKFLYDLL